jgi:hypothetical protein
LFTKFTTRKRKSKKENQNFFIGQFYSSLNDRPMMMNTEACEVSEFWLGVNERYLEEFEEE